MAVRQTCRRPGPIINRPPTKIDNGYNPAFYWNRPDNDYADENGVYPGYASDGYSDRYADNGYAPAYQGYSAAYPSYARRPPMPRRRR